MNFVGDTTARGAQNRERMMTKMTGPSCEVLGSKILKQDGCPACKANTCYEDLPPPTSKQKQAGAKKLGEYRKCAGCVFNHPANSTGKLIQTLVLDPDKFSEGFDTKNVRAIILVSVPSSWPAMQQQIGRAVRHCSHQGVPKESRNVKVYQIIASHPATVQRYMTVGNEIKPKTFPRPAQPSQDERKLRKVFEERLKLNDILCKLSNQAVDRKLLKGEMGERGPCVPGIREPSDRYSQFVLNEIATHAHFDTTRAACLNKPKDKCSGLSMCDWDDASNLCEPKRAGGLFAAFESSPTAATPARPPPPTAPPPPPGVPAPVAPAAQPAPGDFTYNGVRWEVTARPNTQGPFRHTVYIAERARVSDEQPEAGPVMIMKEGDWNRLEVPEVTHEGAFGSDYGKVTMNVPPEYSSYIAVWKFPYDLNRLPGFITIKFPIPVGTYPLYPDGFVHGNGSELVTSCGMKTKEFGMPLTKMRDDIRGVSYLDGIEGGGPGAATKLAVITTMHYVSDYWKLSKKDKINLRSLVEELKEIDVCAISCHGQHHAIVFYSIGPHYTLVGPERVADALQTNPRFLEILSSRAMDPGKVEDWGKRYIKAFGSTSAALYGKARRVGSTMYNMLPSIPKPAAGYGIDPVDQFIDGVDA